MRILDVKYKEPKVTFHSTGKIKFTDDWMVEIETYKEGVLRLFYKKGAIFDGCSAPWFLRWMLPKYGNSSYSTAWLVHDHLFDTHALSFELSNNIFKMLLIRAGLSNRRANLAHFGVNSRIGRNHYENKIDKVNEGLLSFEWSDK